MPAAGGAGLRRMLPTCWRDAAHDGLAAGVVGLTAISAYVSAATLLFQGVLLPHLPVAIGAALLGGAVMSLWAAARGSLALASAGPVPSTVPVLAAITAGAAAECTPATALPTAVAALAITTLAIGAVWWLMGQRRWGDLARYIPYPVIGGFTASVGWLSLAGGLGVSAGEPVGTAHGPLWRLAQAPGPVAAGLAAGGLLWWVMRRQRHPLALPVTIVVIGLAVHAGLWLSGLDTDTARRQGWLLAPLGRTLPAWPGNADLLAAVQWHAVAHQAGLMVAALIVATISLLLSATSLEVAWHARARLNHDLATFGQANLLLGLSGGLLGGLSVSRSVLNRAAGAAGRGSGVALAGLCLLALLLGGPVLSLLPRALLGGLLVYQGLEMLKTWLVDGRARLPGADLATVWAMVLATATVGFLAAVGIGLLACCVSFAVTSAQLAPVRRTIPRAQWPTQVERAPAELAHLKTAGEQAVIVELQGALFFGSTTQLLRQVEALLVATPRPRRVLLDFQHVRRLDSSAAQALARLFARLRQQGVAVEVSRLADEMQAALAHAGAWQAGTVLRHAQIDDAVRAWDDATLAQAGLRPVPLQHWLAQTLPDVDALPALLGYFQPLDLAPGQRLFAQGDASDAMYLVETGRLAAVIDAPQGPLTVRTVNPGGAVGEMGLFRGTPRSAHVQAELPSRLWCLSRAGLQAMERERPDLAAALYRLFVRQLADRLDQSTSQLTALAR